MKTNFRYLCSLTGVAKSLTLILGLFSVSLMGHAYDNSFYNNQIKAIYESKEYRFMTVWLKGLFPSYFMGLQNEVFFLSASIVCLLFSLGFFLCHLLTEELENSRAIRYMDIGFHCIASIMLIIGAYLVICSAIDISKLESKYGSAIQYKAEKIASGVFSAINSVVYGFVTTILITR